MQKNETKPSMDTKIVHGTGSEHSTHMDLVAPIHMTSTFKLKNVEHGAGIFDGTEQGYTYTRISNPTIDLLQKKIAILEGGEAGIATSSGMAAIASTALTLAKPGDNFISCSTVYGGTFALFKHHLKNFNIQQRVIVPAAFSSKNRIEKLMDEKTRFLYLETPANPTLDVIDIEMWGSIARKHGKILIVDNTFATPYLQNPLQLGADIVVHSATKYLGGHGDIIGGIVVGTEKMIARIKKEYVQHFGPVISPFNAWLVLRGIKTLALRMERHSENALKIAAWLENHPKVKKVYYPGLISHPGHQIAKNQMKRFSGMLSFEVKGGIKAGKLIMNNVELCILAVSLGDCETLIQHPASMTHATYTREEREIAGISDGLVRLSVGLEHADDIIADLEQALARVEL